MKARIPSRIGIKLAFLSVVWAANLGPGIIGAVAQEAFSPAVEIQSVSEFYDPLTSYGRWFDLPPYGRCWHPTMVAADWRPYSVGHWE